VLIQDCHEYDRKAKNNTITNPLEAVKYYKNASNCWNQLNQPIHEKKSLENSAKILTLKGKENEDPNAARVYLQTAYKIYNHIGMYDEAEKVKFVEKQNFITKANQLLNHAKSTDDLFISENLYQKASELFTQAEERIQANHCFNIIANEYIKYASSINNPRMAFYFYHKASKYYNIVNEAEKEKNALITAAKLFVKETKKIKIITKNLPILIYHYSQAIEIYVRIQERQRSFNLQEEMVELCSHFDVKIEDVLTILDKHHLKPISFDIIPNSQAEVEELLKSEDIPNIQESMIELIRQNKEKSIKSIKKQADKPIPIDLKTIPKPSISGIKQNNTSPLHTGVVDQTISRNKYKVPENIEEIESKVQQKSTVKYNQNFSRDTSNEKLELNIRKFKRLRRHKKSLSQKKPMNTSANHNKKQTTNNLSIKSKNIFNVENRNKITVSDVINVEEEAEEQYIKNLKQKEFLMRNQEFGKLNKNISHKSIKAHSIPVPPVSNLFEKFREAHMTLINENKTIIHGPIIDILHKLGYLSSNLVDEDELISIPEFQVLLFIIKNNIVSLDEIQSNMTMTTVPLILSNLQADNLIFQTNDYRWTVSKVITNILFTDKKNNQYNAGENKLNINKKVHPPLADQKFLELMVKYEIIHNQYLALENLMKIPEFTILMTLNNQIKMSMGEIQDLVNYMPSIQLKTLLGRLQNDGIIEQDGNTDWKLSNSLKEELYH